MLGALPSQAVRAHSGPGSRCAVLVTTSLAAHAAVIADEDSFTAAVEGCQADLRVLVEAAVAELRVVLHVAEQHVVRGGLRRVLQEGVQHRVHARLAAARPLVPQRPMQGPCRVSGRVSATQEPCHRASNGRATEYAGLRSALLGEPSSVQWASHQGCSGQAIKCAMDEPLGCHGPRVRWTPMDP